tara:strand:- start:775 stop:1584 length:810 start_codon:yes stop_codon:yes gene_type:complete
MINRNSPFLQNNMNLTASKGMLDKNFKYFDPDAVNKNDEYSKNVAKSLEKVNSSNAKTTSMNEWDGQTYTKKGLTPTGEDPQLWGSVDAGAAMTNYETKSQTSGWTNFLDGVNSVATGLGMTPGWGLPADIFNGVFSGVRTGLNAVNDLVRGDGDYSMTQKAALDTGFATVSAIPGPGIATGATKLGLGVTRAKQVSDKVKLLQKVNHSKLGKLNHANHIVSNTKPALTNAFGNETKTSVGGSKQNGVLSSELMSNMGLNKYGNIGNAP